MSKFKVGDMVMFKAYEHNISLFEGYTPLDLYEPQEVEYVIGDGSILLGNDREWWHESYFEHFDEWAKHQKKFVEDVEQSSYEELKLRLEQAEELLDSAQKQMIWWQNEFPVYGVDILLKEIDLFLE